MKKFVKTVSRTIFMIFVAAFISGCEWIDSHRAPALIAWIVLACIQMPAAFLIAAAFLAYKWRTTGNKNFLYGAAAAVAMMIFNDIFGTVLLYAALILGMISIAFGIRRESSLSRKKR